MSDLRGDILGWLDPDGGIPLSRRQDGHLIKELVYAREKICSVFGLVRHVVEYLHRTSEIKCKAKVEIQQKHIFFFLL